VASEGGVKASIAIRSRVSPEAPLGAWFRRRSVSPMFPYRVEEAITGLEPTCKAVEKRRKDGVARGAAAVERPSARELFFLRIIGAFRSRVAEPPPLAPSLPRPARRGSGGRRATFMAVPASLHATKELSSRGGQAPPSVPAARGARELAASNRSTPRAGVVRPAPPPNAGVS